MIDAYSLPTITQDAATWSAAHGLAKPKLVINDNALERHQPQGPTIPTDATIVVQSALSPENSDLHMAQNKVVSGNEWSPESPEEK